MPDQAVSAGESEVETKSVGPKTGFPKTQPYKSVGPKTGFPKTQPLPDSPEGDSAEIDAEPEASTTEPSD